MKEDSKFQKIDYETWLANLYRFLRLLCGHVRAFATDRAVRAAHAAQLRKWLRANWLSLLISVILAAIVYYFIHERPALEFDRNVAVRVRKVPEGRRVVADPSEIKVTFRGSREDMNAIEMSPPTIDVSYPKFGISTNVTTLKVSQRNVELSGLRGSGAASVVRLAVGEVRLKEDIRISLDFKIEPPVIKGIPYGGRIAEIVSYEPKSVQVTGGGGKLGLWEQNSKQLRLGEISVEGRADSFTATPAILPPRDDDGIDIQIAKATAKVEVQIREPRTFNAIPDIPVRLSLWRDVFLPKGTGISPTNVTVTIVGSTNTISTITASDIAVYAEIDSLPEVFTNAVEASLSVRVPHNSSIFETSVNPGFVVLTPPPPPPEPEPEPPALDLTETAPAEEPAPSAQSGEDSETATTNTPPAQAMPL